MSAPNETTLPALMSSDLILCVCVCKAFLSVRVTRESNSDSWANFSHLTTLTYECYIVTLAVSEVLRAEGIRPLTAEVITFFCLMTNAHEYVVLL